MEYQFLGATGLSVSRMCFGALTIGPLQANLPLRNGAAVLKAALAAGVNFIDTAELYGSYPYIRRVLASNRDVIVASKSYAYSYEGMRESVEGACRELGRDYIDIFLLHEQTSRLTLKGHGDALRFLCDAKKSGLIRAAGVSTHTIEVVRAAALIEEIDVIHPLLNRDGIGIMDGTAAAMLDAIHFAKDAGKGIYSMKPLGGGHLSHDAENAIAWVLAQSGIDSVAIGMQSIDEVILNLAFFTGQNATETMRKKVAARSRRLLVEDWCSGCGTCAAYCPAKALSIEEGRAVCNQDICVLCGYCGARCPEFCLKII